MYFKPASALAWNHYFGVANPAGGYRYFLSRRGDNAYPVADIYVNTLTAGAGAAIDDSAAWFILAASIPNPSASAPARFHVHDGTSWAHIDSTANVVWTTTPDSADRIKIGQINTGSYSLDGDVVCAGIKKALMSDAEIEALSRTNFQSWYNAGFHWLVGFDDAGTQENRMSPGTGDEVGRTGTSFVAGPAGWDWTITAAVEYTDSGTITVALTPSFVEVPPSATTLPVTDTFTRTVAAGGWGTSDSGHEWTPDANAAQFSADGDEGAIGTSTGESWALVPISAADVEVVAKVRETAPAGTNYASVIGRRIPAGQFYAGHIYMGTSDVVIHIARNYGSYNTIVGPYTVKASAYTPGDYYWIKLQVIGTTVRMRAWKDGDAEPGTWQLSTTDTLIAGAGKVGAGRGGFNAGETIYFADYSAVSVSSAIDYPDSGTVTLTLTPTLTEAFVGTITDTFTRSVSNDWGTATTGQVWSKVSGPTNLNVDGSKGRFYSVASTDNYQMVLPDVLTDTDILIKARTAAVDFTGSNDFARVCARFQSAGNEYRFTAYLTSSTNILMGVIQKVAGGVVTDIAGPVAVGVSYAADDWIWIRAHLLGTSLHMKVWKDGSGEPSSWLLAVTDATYLSGQVGIAADFSNTGSSHIFEYDSLSISQSPSAVATDFIDSGTIPLTLTPSLAEVYSGAAAYTDSGTVYLDLTPALAEVYTSAGNIDSDTITVTLRPRFWPRRPVLPTADDTFERASLLTTGNWSYIDPTVTNQMAIFGSSDLAAVIYNNRGIMWNQQKYDPDLNDIVMQVKFSVVPITAHSIGVVIGQSYGYINWYGYYFYYGVPSGLVPVWGIAKIFGGVEIPMVAYSGTDGAPLMQVNDHLVGVHKPNGDLELWRYTPSTSTWEFMVSTNDLTYTADMYVGIMGKGPASRIEEFGFDVVTSDVTGVPGDFGTIYVDLTPSGNDFVHRCRGRFRGELLSWGYYPDGMYSHWSSVFYGSTWRGDLLPIEMVVNYEC